MNHKSLTALLLLTCCFFNPAYADKSAADKPVLQIKNAWVAEAPPVSKVMAAYMTLVNTGPNNIEIVAAKSHLYSSIEFHETQHKGDIASMVRHERLTVPANGKLELKRGGVHLMLFNPKKSLKAGDSITIKLIAADNNVTKVSIPVKKPRY